MGSEKALKTQHLSAKVRMLKDLMNKSKAPHVFTSSLNEAIKSLRDAKLAGKRG